MVQSVSDFCSPYSVRNRYYIIFAYQLYHYYFVFSNKWSTNDVAKKSLNDSDAGSGGVRLYGCTRYGMVWCCTLPCVFLSSVGWCARETYNFWHLFGFLVNFSRARIDCVFAYSLSVLLLLCCAGCVWVAATYSRCQTWTVWPTMLIFIISNLSSWIQFQTARYFARISKSYCCECSLRIFCILQNTKTNQLLETFR